MKKPAREEVGGLIWDAAREEGVLHSRWRFVWEEETANRRVSR